VLNEQRRLLREEASHVVQQAIEALFRGSALDMVRALRRISQLQETYDSFHNITVVNVTTPANLFHVLRRQVHRAFAKPLVVMSAKFLLHHRPCRSPLTHMAEGTRFQRLIIEGGEGDNMPAHSRHGSLKRLIFCSGKVFYELYHARATRKLQDAVALARLEQIAPFPSMEVTYCAGCYPNAEILWVQEEPKNMGAWAYVAPRIATSIQQLGRESCARQIRYVGRPPAANPATPLFKQHKKEVRAI